jgi:hypothetical protein
MALFLKAAKKSAYPTKQPSRALSNMTNRFTNIFNIIRFLFEHFSIVELKIRQQVFVNISSFLRVALTALSATMTISYARLIKDLKASRSASSVNGSLVTETWSIAWWNLITWSDNLEGGVFDMGFESSASCSCSCESRPGELSGVDFGAIAVWERQNNDASFDWLALPEAEGLYGWTLDQVLVSVRQRQHMVALQEH